MSEPTIPAYSHDDFASVYEKKAYHDFLLGRRSSVADRRSKRNQRSATEAAIRWRRIWSVALTVARWSGVFMGGCLIGSAVTLVVQNRAAGAEAGILASIGVVALTLVLVVGRVARIGSMPRPEPTSRIPELRLPRSSAVG